MKPDPKSEAVTVRFSSTEKQGLEQLANLYGQTLAEYIRERVLAESGREEQVLRLLFDELASAAKAADQTKLKALVDEAPEQLTETSQAQRERIMKEVRASLTDAEIEGLRRFFQPAFDKGLWPGAVLQEKKDGL